ncbi:ABC transporter ATP-binding protein [Virgibacillus oceani]
MSFLEINNITKKFGDKTALRHFSMDLKENEVLGVIGHNGAGKTTLFKLILDMYKPDQGEITISDQTFHIKNDIGYLPEERGLFGKTDVYSQLLGFGMLKGKNRTELMSNIDFWMEFFQVEEYRNEMPANLSKGNQQKIQFITAVIHYPAFLILDEPFSGLDPINVDVFADAIQYMKKKGSTIIYSSHKLDSIEHLSNRLLFLKDGKKIYLDYIENIQKKYGHRLKVKNDSLTETMLLDHGFQFECINGVFEITLQERKDAEYIAALLPNTYSEMFLIEKPSIEEIFKHINNGGRL